MFFDEHPRFRETSSTAASISRLNWRHRAIFEDNLDLFPGARVLDLASHDGRWSLAAADAGAAHVTGIEGRAELVKHAEDNMGHYGVPPDAYRFIKGDILDVLADPDGHELRADVVLCLGFLYHTLRYPELLSSLRRLGAPHLVIDTAVIAGDRRIVRLQAEDVGAESNATDSDQTHEGIALTGRPTTKALEFMLETYGFEVVKRFDWPRALEGQRAEWVEKYRTGLRVTWVARMR